MNKLKPIAKLLSGISMLGVCCLPYTSALSASMPKPIGYYFQATGAMSWSNIGKTQNWAMNSIVQNRYVNKKGIIHAYSFGLNGGWTFNCVHNTRLQLGAGIYHAGNYKSKGFVQEDLLPSQQNLAYEYKVTSNRLMAEARLLFPVIRNYWIPYISLGAGAARNRAYGYSETAITPAGLPGDPFANKTTYSFAYQGGLGIIFKPEKNIGIILGYQYVNLGNAKLGSIPNQTTSDRIKTGSMQTNNVTVGFVWFSA